jgi:dienelactone hydrolase
MSTRRWLATALAATLLISSCSARHTGSVAAATGGVRELTLSRGDDRPLPTTVWYPTGPDGTTVAPGRHPIILFSHGVGGLPEQFAPLASTWVAAGFVVAAPAYPHTNGRSRLDPGDIRQQPADAAYVLRRVRELDTSPGDPLAGHLDVTNLAAVGFSAGGTTTMGLFTNGHDRALQAAVSIAGRAPVTPFGGPAAPFLFLHGDQDPVVPISAGRAAYEAVPWPKRFVTMPGQGHGQFLNPGDRDYARSCELILAFLRAHLTA